MILCADGLTGIKESISVAFPNTEYQRCIVHQVRNTLKYVSYIESLNAQFKRLNRNRSVFPTKSSLEKALFLSVEKISKKWTHPIRNWGSIFAELSIMFEERISY